MTMPAVGTGDALSSASGSTAALLAVGAAGAAVLAWKASTAEGTTGA